MVLPLITSGVAESRQITILADFLVRGDEYYWKQHQTLGLHIASGVFMLLHSSRKLSWISYLGWVFL